MEQGRDGGRGREDGKGGEGGWEVVWPPRQGVRLPVAGPLAIDYSVVVGC